MKIEVKRAEELGEAFRHRIAAVLTQGFTEDFAFFSKDARTLADAFAPMLILQRFFVALVDGEPAAAAAVTEGEQECFEPRRQELQRVLGPVHGYVSYRIIRSQCMGAHDGAREGLTEIAFVTTAPQHHGKGVATALKPYAKFGFTETHRRRVRFAQRAGLSSYVSMGFARARAS